MPVEFIGREVAVELSDDEVKVPVAFVLGQRRHVIAAVLVSWQDHGFGSVGPQRANWRLRRHRNYYRVKTSQGEVYELYADRGVGLKPGRRVRWYVSKRLS